MSKLLINESPLQVLPSLAIKYGLNEAIVIQQLHYWLIRSTNIEEDKKWVYNSISEWHKQFPFWSEKTISRILKKLCDIHLVIKGNYNKMPMDKTLWCTLDDGQLGPTIQTSCLNEQDNVTEAIPETTTETTPKIKTIDIKIPEYIELELWNDFIVVRKKLKAPNTERALNGLLKKLDLFEQTSQGSANESIDESIMNGWKGVFAPKKQGQQKLTFPWPNLVVVENAAFPNGMLYVDKDKGICYETSGKKSDIYDWNKSIGGVTA